VDLPQALEMLVPGAYLATQFGAFSYNNLALQGSRPGDVLWTVDGVRVSNRLYVGTSPADTLPASMVERLEVMKGGNGVLYGTQAAAGVINVVTRAFSDTPDGALSLGLDSRDGHHLDGYGRGAFGGHRFVGWASKDRSDGYRPYDAYQPGASTRDRRYDVESYGLKYGYGFTDSLRLTLQGEHTEAALDYPTVFTTDVNDRNQDIWSARLDYSPSETFELFFKGYLHDWDTDYIEDAVGAPVTYFWGFRDLGLSGAARIDAGHGLAWHMGYEYQQYKGRDDFLLIAEQEEKVHALFAQLRTTDDLSSRAHLTAGLRYTDSGSADALVWSTSGVYEFTDNLYVEGTLGTSFLLPDAYQLYAIDPFDTRGNADLEAEESFNVNLAVGGTFEAGSRPMGWQVIGWRRSVENLIISDDSNPPPGFDSVFINVDGKVKVSGYELLLRGALAPALSFDASFLYSRELGANGRQLQNRPRRSAKLALELAPPGQPWGVNLALKYVGRMYTNVTGFAPQVYGMDVIANLGGHWFFDNERRHRLGMRVENLFDIEYETRIRSAVLQGSDPATRFMFRNQGAPRTLYANYTFAF
jgi:vitamin B12 transporter